MKKKCINPEHKNVIHDKALNMCFTVRGTFVEALFRKNTSRKA